MGLNAFRDAVLLLRSAAEGVGVVPNTTRRGLSCLPRSQGSALRLACPPHRRDCSTDHSTLHPPPSFLEHDTSEASEPLCTAAYPPCPQCIPLAPWCRRATEAAAEDAAAASPSSASSMKLAAAAAQPPTDAATVRPLHPPDANPYAHPDPNQTHDASGRTTCVD